MQECLAALAAHGATSCFCGSLDQPGPELDAPPGDPLRGASVHFLKNRLLQMLGLEETSELCVYNVEPQIREFSAAAICPRDHRPGAALVDVISRHAAGRSTHMLSYGWGYRVADIARALHAYCLKEGLEPQSTYVWICFLCINQHRVKEMQASGKGVPFEEFEDTFGSRVRAIGHVVALLSPWHSPLYTQRAWCVYELYVAATTDGVSFSLILPPQDEADMFQALSSGGGKQLWEAMTGIRVQSAKASVEEDRLRLLQLIEAKPGYAKLNQLIVRLLREWFVDIAEVQLKKALLTAVSSDCCTSSSSESPARHCVQVADWMSRVGASARGAQLVDAGLQVLGPATSENAADAAALHTTMVWLQYMLFDFKAAMEAAARAQQSFRLAGNECTEDAALCQANAGMVLQQLGDCSAALQAYEAAVAIHDSLGTKLSKERAGIYRTIGELHHQLRDFDKAFEAFDKAWQMWQELGMERSTSGAATLCKRAALQVDAGQPEEALDALQTAWNDVYEPLGLSESPGAADCLATKGRALLAIGDQVAAQESLKRAIAIFEAAGLGHVESVQQLRDLCSAGRETAPKMVKP